MLTQEFIKLLKEACHGKKNIRGYDSKWPSSGVYRIRDEITEKIGDIVSCLQELIDQDSFGKKIDKHNEYLMIYNFQILHQDEENAIYLCNLEMTIKPNSMDDLNSIDNGEKFHLVVGKIGKQLKIGNTSWAEELMGCYEQEESAEAPESYEVKPKAIDCKEKLEAVQARFTTVTPKELVVEAKVKSEAQKAPIPTYHHSDSASQPVAFAYHQSRASQTPSPTAPLDSSSLAFIERINELNALKINYVSGVRS